MNKQTGTKLELTHLKEVKVAVAGQLARFHLFIVFIRWNYMRIIHQPIERISFKAHHVTVDCPKLLTGGKPAIGSR